MPLFYGYTYDKLNRLTKADGIVGDFIPDQANSSIAMLNEAHRIGDEEMAYDEIGNITSLYRGVKSTVLGELLEAQNFTYKYLNQTNRLMQVLNNGASSRQYSYDANGNLLTDNVRDVQSTEYGRAAYAYHISQTNKEISYLYSIDDQRMYKEIISQTETKREYYLTDAMGHVVGLRTETTSVGQSNTTTSWEYYLHGSEREARLLNTDANPKFESNEVNFFLYDHLGNMRMSYTPQITDVPGSDVVVFEDLFLNNSTEGWTSYMNGSVVSNTSGILNVQNSGGYPVCTKPDVPLNGNGSSYTLIVNVQFDNTTSGLYLNWSSANPIALVNGINEITAYGNGSIGNITIAPTQYSTISSFEVKYVKLTQHIPPSIDISYTVNHVVDYYPYGKVVREFVEGEKERYLTTQHVRDEETGLDYRGARYYDSDVARFLSLDPLAADFAAWSAFSYVLGNPLAFIDKDGKAATPPDWYKDENGNIEYYEGVTAPSFTQYVDVLDGEKTIESYEVTWTRIPEWSPNETESQGLSNDVDFGVTTATSIIQAAAQTVIDEGPFKYAEGPGVAKDAHIPGAKLITNLATKASGVYAVGDKVLDTYNAASEGDWSQASEDATVAAGYATATVMMCAPTGVSQIAGGVMFIAFAIYDACND